MYMVEYNELARKKWTSYSFIERNRKTTLQGMYHATSKLRVLPSLCWAPTGEVQYGPFYILRALSKKLR